MKLLLAILYLLLLALAGCKTLSLLAIQMANPTSGAPDVGVWILFILELVAASLVYHHYQDGGEGK